jgi:hypothetical protein
MFFSLLCLQADDAPCFKVGCVLGPGYWAGHLI